MKKPTPLTALVCFLCLEIAPAFPQGTFTEWTIPTPNSEPHCVVSDSKGRIWYAAFGANQVGMFDPATEEFRELRPPTDRKSTRLNSSHIQKSRMPSSA